MIVTFGEQPPVYAKSRSEMQQSSTPYPVQCKYILLRNLIFYLNLIFFCSLIYMQIFFLQHSCLYLVVEVHRVLAFHHIHQILNTLVAAMYIRHIRLQHLVDFHIPVLIVLMLEPLLVIQRKATVVHIHHIHQRHNRYHNYLC